MHFLHSFYTVLYFLFYNFTLFAQSALFPSKTWNPILNSTAIFPGTMLNCSMLNYQLQCTVLNFAVKCDNSALHEMIHTGVQKQTQQIKEASESLGEQGPDECTNSLN